MTNQTIQVPANLPEATILDRLRQFLLSNTYYELESEGELRFTNYPEHRNEASPATSKNELSFSLSGDQLRCTYKSLTQTGYSDWESLYTKLFMQELQTAIETGKINMLDLADLEKTAAARLYRSVPKWVNWGRWIAAGLVYVLLMAGQEHDDDAGFFDFFLRWQFWLALGLAFAVNLFYRRRYRTPLAKGTVLPNGKSN